MLTTSVDRLGAWLNDKNAYGMLIMKGILMENLLTGDEIDWLCKFLEGRGSNNEMIMKIVTITTKLQKMKRK